MSPTGLTKYSFRSTRRRFSIPGGVLALRRTILWNESCDRPSRYKKADSGSSHRANRPASFQIASPASRGFSGEETWFRRACHTGIALTPSEVNTNCQDGLGRVTAVIEPDGTLTNYAYDLLNNLTGVSQGGQTTASCPSGQLRCFVYNSALSQLTSATNPESGTATYSYDGDGNVQQIIDGQGVTTTLQYDPLSRLTSKSYSIPSGQQFPTTPTSNVSRLLNCSSRVPPEIGAILRGLRSPQVPLTALRARRRASKARILRSSQSGSPVVNAHRALTARVLILRDRDYRFRVPSHRRRRYRDRSPSRSMASCVRLQFVVLRRPAVGKLLSKKYGAIRHFGMNPSRADDSSPTGNRVAASQRDRLRGVHIPPIGRKCKERSCPRPDPEIPICENKIASIAIFIKEDKDTVVAVLNLVTPSAGASAPSSLPSGNLKGVTASSP
jgi:YD repeat-containing protein